MPPPNVPDRLTADTAWGERFRRDWTALTGTRGDDRALVALSGGADSTALLLLLHALIGDRCIAATVDHGLRPEAAGEARAVASMCRDLGIAHVILAGPLPDRAGRTANVAARARALRYDLLERQAVEAGAAWIATGHHADDQLETLVMRLNRGAGVGGMAGVRARSGKVVRPLLGWRRGELAAIVADHGIVAIADPSNHDDRFDRARLRKRLAGADWLDAGMSARTAAALDEAHVALDWATERAVRECCTFDTDMATIRNDSLPAEILRRLTLLCLHHVEPGIDPRGGDLTRFLAALTARETVMIGDVVATASVDGGASLYHFRAAPPRRNT